MKIIQNSHLNKRKLMMSNFYRSGVIWHHHNFIFPVPGHYHAGTVKISNFVRKSGIILSIQNLVYFNTKNI